MTGDFQVMGLVGQNEPGRGITFHEPARDRRVGRIAANQTVRPELKDVAEAGD
jgi:hypothetical protein